MPKIIRPPQPRSGAVKVCVPMQQGVGVIQITNGSTQKPVTKHYLLRVVGSQRFSLTAFVEEGGESYVVNLTPGYVSCDCPDSKFNHLECKHLLSLKALIKQGKL